MHLKKSPFVTTLGITIAMTSVAAHADIAEVKWTAGAFAHTASIAPGKVLETCGKLTAGDKVAWNFKTAGLADFNIHYHAGKDVTFIEKQEQKGAAEGTLAAPVDQTYCWMWKNTSPAAIEVSVQLKQPAPK